jgi:hypothetical protein
MGKSPDVFPSPTQRAHDYVVSDRDTDPHAPELHGVTQVTYLTPEGATTLPVAERDIDDLKLHPRLGKTLAEIIMAANYEWPLVDNDGGHDGQY